MLRLRSCKLTNYKAYRDETSIAFSSTVTYVLGPNNSGKTSLLEAIHTPSMAPHRSPRTIPRVGDAPRSVHSAFKLSFSTTGDALRDFLLSAQREFGILATLETLQTARHETLLQSLLSQPELRFEVAITSQGTFVSSSSWFAHVVNADSPLSCARYRSRPELGQFDSLGSSGTRATDPSDVGLLLYDAFRQRVFRFRAERSRALTGIVTPGSELAQDADNLVQVLDNLQGRPAKYRQYLEYVRRVLPEIHGLGVFATEQNKKGIRVWFFEGEREDFAMPLELAGSGVPNILAQLYTITMSPQPRLIIIDEPSAFLHPGATRELIRVIREFPQHQYVISSHQPIALDELSSVGMVLLHRDADGATTAQSVDPDRLEDQQAVLTTVGASLSDVFSADRVLWVEGTTETKVFRTVAGRVGLPRGAAILPLVHTGDLDSASATLAIEIYRRLTESGALLPPAIAIVLDDEGRTAEEKSELRKRVSNTQLEFLPVRMIENVFLDTDLVGEFLKRESQAWGPATRDYSPAAIATYWDGLLDSRRFKVDYQRQADVARWTAQVHGARVLDDTFSHFTENRLAFDKVKHGPRLTNVAAEVSPQLLNPIEAMLRRLLGS